MAWTDKPTEAQLNTIFYWLRWEMPTNMAREAVAYLKENGDRKSVSEEMGRLKRLKDKRRLDRKGCFDSEIWSAFKPSIAN